MIPARPRRWLPALALVVLAPLAGCGGGRPRDEVPPPVPELLLAASSTSPAISLASDGDRLWVGKVLGLATVDKESGTVEPVVEQLLERDAQGLELGTVDHASDLVRSGDWVYFHSWGYRIQRLFVGPGLASAEELVPASAFQAACCQAEGFAATDAELYWSVSSGDTRRVFARRIDGGPVRLVATFPGHAELTAVPGRIYVVGTSPQGVAVRALDPASGVIVPLHGQVGVAMGRVARAASASRFFWMDGGTLWSVPHAGTVPAAIATGLDGIVRLAAGDDGLYALRVGTGGATVLHVDIETGSAEPVLSRADIRAILPYGERIWWVSGLTLESAALDGSDATVAWAGDGTGLVLGDTGRAGLHAAGGRIVAVSGERDLLVYDPVAGTSEEISSASGATDVVAAGGRVLAASWNAGVTGIPLGAPLRRPELLRGGLATIEAMFLEGDWLYWSEWSDFYGTYRISRIRTDGTEFEVLLDGDHRQLAVHAGRLWFLCEATCELESWSLVSMALDGGPPRPEMTAGLFPQRLVAANGLLLLVDTEDGTSFGVWAIDAAARRAAKVVGGLPLRGVDVQASARWLYVSTFASEDGARLDRYPIRSWDAVGEPQRVDTGADPLVLAFRTDGAHLYYWAVGEGLKRLVE